ncbi:DUF6262 family protein [Streptomyces meridianus]|uniref:DUF6262 family protein n=1 Tax=Streptomyces meridianus TaxID=2938945 RepID=A0ABT0XAX4_9ACTN|nr:DUF6262 family protein [Streptomyces meridianus]MCM2579676.1 DUF6262 family protein [Streptomyces meridianus]
MPATAPPAATAARRRQAQAKLAAVQQAIAQLRRETGHLTVTAIARRAGVSSTFLYENPQARSMVKDAVTATRDQRARHATDEHDRVEATWRERALNAEEGLVQAHNEIRAQRTRIGELMGQLRDKEMTASSGESNRTTASENATLKRRVRQLMQEHRELQERLEGCRTNLRFAESRISELEVQLVEHQLGGQVCR